jgi:glycosyltransferase involved in cell wall biosynthesis
MIKVSFVIGAYNAQDLILMPLRSIYESGLPEEEFEVIVVDDCSSDNTVKVCEEFSRTHGNYLLIRQEKNHKLGAARNRGLRAARGVYVQFVDADDEIGDEFLQALNEALLNEVDVQKNDALIQRLGDDWERVSTDGGIQLVMPASSFCEEVYSTAPHYGGAAFYLWRRQYLEKMSHPFIENRLMEDIDWVEYHLAHAEVIGCCNSVTYKYYINGNSITHKPSIRTLSDYVLQCYRRIKGQELYKDTLPVFSEKIYSYCIMRINSLLRYRHLTKFRKKDFPIMYASIGDDVRKDLLSYKFSPFATFCLRHKSMTIFILSVSCIMARVGRRIVQIHRT